MLRCYERALKLKKYYEKKNKEPPKIIQKFINKAFEAETGFKKSNLKFNNNI